MGGGRDHDQRKFEELILYVALRSEGSIWYGRTKLLKILWLSDFEAFRRLGKSITGATYRKFPYGPVPKEFPDAVRHLEATKAAAERRLDAFGKDQRQLLALREANLALFTADEISIVDQIIQRFWNYNASDIKDFAHRHPGWRLAAMDEEIPYETVILPEQPRELSSEEMTLARAAVSKIRSRG